MPERICQTIHSVLNALNDLIIRHVALPIDNGYEYLPIEDIIYCQSNGNFTTFFLSNSRKLLIKQGMKYFEDTLPAYTFLRVHKRYLINIQHIKRYEKGDGGTIIFHNNEKVPVARDRKTLFLNILLKRVDKSN
jgi:two-component system LytT family response regulator